MKALKTILLSTILMMGTTFGSESILGSGNVLPNSENVEAVGIFTKFKEFQSTVKRTVIRVLTGSLNGQKVESITLNGLKLDKESSFRKILDGVSTVIKELVKERDELKAEKSELEKALSDAKADARESIENLTSELEALKGENADLRKRPKQASGRFKAAKYKDDIRKANDPGSAESEEDDVLSNIVLLSGVSQPKNQSTTVTLSEEAKAIRIAELEKIVEKGRPPEWKNADGKEDPTDSRDNRYNAFLKKQKALKEYDAAANELKELKNNTNDEGQATAE